MTASPLFRRSLPGTILLMLASLAGRSVSGADSVNAPRPVPLTRPEMKQLIEDVKVRTPRIPFPELTDEDRKALGEQAGSYEAALRHCYTPWNEFRRGPRSGPGGSREQDPEMTLSYAFKTQLFWIVSRANNCQYCIGHQESKLLSAGLSEDQIAALDGDWLAHTPAERTAFAFARRLAYEPHLLSDADIEALRTHYSDKQILEMVMSVSRNNVSNRWKEGIGVPQRADEGGYSRSSDNPSLPRGSYLTATSERYRSSITKVAPLTLDGTGQPTRMAQVRRPPLESRAEVDRMLALTRTRKPRLPVPAESVARKALGDAAPAGALPQWMRLLTTFPREGVNTIAGFRAAEEKGELSPLLKAQMSWITARHDRAWYALALAHQQLKKLGQSDAQVDALDGDWSGFPAHEQSLFTVARKLAASPVILTDRDVKNAVELAGPRAVVESINYVSLRASFNRFTEAAGLAADQ